MNQQEFEDIKVQFEIADVDTKIDMYIGAEGLTQSQYKELLRMFPMEALDKLETALA